MTGNGNNTRLKLKEALRNQAHALGFDAVGFAAPQPPPGAEQLRPWLAQGRHGSMVWLEKNVAQRLDPALVVPGVGVVVTLGMNYRPPLGAAEDQSASHRPGIAAFARNEDYHDVIQSRLGKLARWLEQTWGNPLGGRVFVDTAPVMEKPLAVASGLGWQGKNTLLVSRRWGCWLFLGEYFLPLDLPPDRPFLGHHCGTCRRCCDVCPTGALDGHGGLDARRCIAYLTLESKDPIPREYRESMGNRVVGCDECLTICPWNRFTPATQEKAFLPRQDLDQASLLEWTDWDEAQFRHFFKKSGIKRMGRGRFLRNVAIALGNWGEEAAVNGLIRLTQESDPLIRGAVAWGLGQAVRQKKSQTAQTLAAAHLKRWVHEESDPLVLAEIDEAMA
ncbi:MAG: tRNA epoxyqueuosine(34) reductase QueG [Magnetococcales bacterium]|nr:tRNA epoxyqueuosine(34) reductase QueG [Magnetococcales bacterium]